MDLVSVIIPVYNLEKYIARCLDSLMNQTYKNLEIITINDGSTDDSLKILKDYANKDNRIVVHDKPNSGVSNTRNIGIDMAKGKYITFVDGDDWLDLNAIEELYNYAKDNDADIVKGCYVKDWGYKQIVCNMSWDNMLVSKNEIYKKFVLTYELNSMWGQIIRTDLVKNNNVKIDEDFIYGEDLLFNCELYTLAERIVLVNKPYYHYFYDNSNSVTNNRTVEKVKSKVENSIKTYKRLVEYVKRWNMPDLEEPAKRKVIQEFIYRTKELFVIDLTHETLENIVRTNFSNIEKVDNVQMQTLEDKLMAKYLLKGNINGYVKLGKFIRKMKNMIKKGSVK